jgi:hypothetical protein
MRIKSTLIAATSLALLVGSMLSVAAQEQESDGQSVAYATGTAGDPQAVVEPTQQRTSDGQIQIRGLQLDDIPVQFSDPRLSGLLTISSNGAGRDFADGHARLEPRSYRIATDGGAWSGSGERILVLSVQRPRPLINHESMVLLGEGRYEGLVAYVFIELANEEPELEAVILDIEMAPLPDPITAMERPEITGPQRPMAGVRIPAGSPLTRLSHDEGASEQLRRAGSKRVCARVRAPHRRSPDRRP